MPAPDAPQTWSEAAHLEEYEEIDWGTELGHDAAALVLRVSPDAVVADAVAQVRARSPPHCVTADRSWHSSHSARL